MTHPYHDADTIQFQRSTRPGDFRTQFIAEPKFSPMPEQSVVAGGRIYKVMGHIAHKANQNEMLNTLLCINAYNGTILWKRPSPPGFMIHRNTMVATDDALYMGDHESCKVIDGVTGEVRDQLTVSKDISDGPV
jgi:outer membrane protein assembly factor BamB